MFNLNYNTNAILDIVLPQIFKDDIPAPIYCGEYFSAYYKAESNILRRWEVTLFRTKDGRETLSIKAPTYKGKLYSGGMEAIWTNDMTSPPYLHMYMGGRNWYNGLPLGETIDEQALIMAKEIKEAFDAF